MWKNSKRICSEMYKIPLVAACLPSFRSTIVSRWLKGFGLEKVIPRNALIHWIPHCRRCSFSLTAPFPVYFLILSQASIQCDVFHYGISTHISNPSLSSSCPPLRPLPPALMLTHSTVYSFPSTCHLRYCLPSDNIFDAIFLKNDPLW